MRAKHTMDLSSRRHEACAWTITISSGTPCQRFAEAPASRCECTRTAHRIRDHICYRYVTYRQQPPSHDRRTVDVRHANSRIERSTLSTIFAHIGPDGRQTFALIRSKFIPTTRAIAAIASFLASRSAIASPHADAM